VPAVVVFVSKVPFLSRTLQVLHVALILLAGLGAARPAAAIVCTVQTLCAAPQGACVVSTDHTCDSPATFDLGARALSIPSGVTLAVTGGDGAGVLTITGAATVSLAAGGKITAQGVNGQGGEVVITSAGDVSLAASSSIDVSANAAGGLIQIDVTTSGNVHLSGLLDAHAGKNGSGGDVTVTTDQVGDIIVDTVGPKGIDISAGGDQSDAGTIDLEAAGSLSLVAPVDLTAGCAGDLTLVAGTGNVTIQGAIHTSGSGVDGCGGSVDVTAGGDVAIHGPITLKGPGVGDVTITADGSIDSNVAGAIDASDTLPGDFAGSITFTTTGAGSVTLDGDITATATGDQSNGGGSAAEVDVITGSGSIELAGQIDVSCSGAGASGGIVDVESGLDLILSGPIDAATGNAGTGGGVSMSAQRFASIASSIDVRGGTAGGTIALTSVDSLMVLGDDEGGNPVLLHADGTGAGAQGGSITLTACSLSLFHDAVVSATGTGTFPTAGNLLQGTMQMKVDAKLQAGSANRLEYRDALPTTGPFASISPGPDIELNPALRCCGGDACAPPSTTTTTSSTTSTTGGGSVTTTTSTVVTITLPASTTTSPASTPTTVSTTGPALPATSTTAPPTSCLDQPLAGFDGVDCRLQILSDMLQSQSPDALGGPKSARQLKAKLAQSLHLVNTARTKRKPAPMLRRAKQALNSFRALAKRGMRRHRIDGDLGGQLVDLAAQTAGLLDALRANPQAAAGS
jgi:hypothetical protein